MIDKGFVTRRQIRLHIDKGIGEISYTLKDDDLFLPKDVVEKDYIRKDEADLLIASARSEVYSIMNAQLKENEEIYDKRVTYAIGLSTLSVRVRKQLSFILSGKVDKILDGDSESEIHPPHKSKDLQGEMDDS